MKQALVADDSSTMRTMVSVSFKRLGWECVTANDGNEALELLTTNEFDFIVTDINMPKMDGIELIKQIRKNSLYRNVPIIALTTESGEDKKLQGKEAGADGWMIKPFKPEVLADAIDSLIRKQIQKNN